MLTKSSTNPGLFYYCISYGKAHYLCSVFIFVQFTMNSAHIRVTFSSYVILLHAYCVPMIL